MEALVNMININRVLFVGEGNFSFSTALTELWHTNTTMDSNSHFQLGNVYSTCYEPQPVSDLAKKNIEILKTRGVNVIFDIDATDIKNMKTKLPFEIFEKIIFMFPHIGGKMKIHKNRDLIRKFAECAACFLNRDTNSQIIITLCGGQGGTPFDPVQRAEADTWQVVKMLSYGGLQLVSIGLFEFEKYLSSKESYVSYGYRGNNKWFHTEKGIVHVFEQAQSPFNTPISKKMLQPLSLEDLKAKYIEQKLDLLRNDGTVIGKTLGSIVDFIKQKSSKDFDIKWKPLSKPVLVEDLECLKSIYLGEKVEKTTILKVVMTHAFTLDFSICPVTPYILVRYYDERLKNALLDKCSDAVALYCDTDLIINLAKVSSNSSEPTHEKASFSGDISWQTLWSTKKSLYPPKYSHCLSFWLPSEYSTCQKLDETSLAIVLWTCGYETITRCELIDIYKDENGRIANTFRLMYQSYFFALSPKLVWNIQTEYIAKTLTCLFNISLR